MAERTTEHSEIVLDAIDQPLLLWVDCEFTGLKPSEGHKILEIGALVTDRALHEIDAYQSFIYYRWEFAENLMNQNPWWDNRHEDRVRMQAGLAEAPSLSTVDEDLADMIDEHFRGQKPPLHGNSVHRDQRHIEDQLQLTNDRLNYRIVDVSSLKILGINYRGVEYEGKQHKHYALEDIRESMDEFRFLMRTLGIADLAKLY